MKYRAVGGSTGGQAGTGGSAFERNCESKEEQLSTVLKRSLPGITYLSVQDISGGCGAMFEVYIYSSTFYMLPVKYIPVFNWLIYCFYFQISVEAKEFVGLSTVKQHRLVTESLKSEIAEMHGIRIHTTPSPK